MKKTQENTFSKKAVRLSMTGVGALAALALSSSFAMAQAWPEKPFSLVVPFSAGGTTDVLARALGDQLSKALGQPVIVENKPGAGATLGADIVARSNPDGCPMLMSASSDERRGGK